MPYPPVIRSEEEEKRKLNTQARLLTPSREKRKEKAKNRRKQASK
jgi:hypothetical protein